MSHVNLVPPVREYINSLVHASARDDLLAAVRHRRFIAPRLLGGFLALGVLPVYLVARGTLNPVEAVVFGWFLVPMAVASYLSRTGRYESAQVLSSLALTALVTLIAMMSGGLSSPAAIWLVLVPLEAALCPSRRVVLLAATFALTAAAVLFALGGGGLGVIAPPSSELPVVIIGLSISAATIYAAFLALGAEALARTGSRLLNQEEERYRLLALNMTDVISRHGRGGIALFASPAAEKLFGVPAQELHGHGLFDRIHVTDRPAYLAALADAALGREASVEFRARRRVAASAARDATQFFWLEMRCRSLAPEEASSSGQADVVAVMRDVSERKAQEEAIAEARREAERANDAKTRFLATMSHELRTPLNAVIGFSEMLMNESTMPLDAAKRRDYARLIHDSGQHLLSVVNLVLDMSKLDTGNFVITVEAFSPAPVVRNCCDLLALKAREAGLDIVLHLPGELPEMIADMRALKQMLFNLLSNAIKFTDRGGRITVGAEADGGHLVITIEDTGIGISEDDLPRVGDAFFQARSTYNRPYEGTGLGLSIVKGLAELHGGQMQVESRLGIGTRVTVRLPLDAERGRSGRPAVVDLNPHREPAPAAEETKVWSQPGAKKSA